MPDSNSRLAISLLETFAVKVDGRELPIATNSGKQIIAWLCLQPNLSEGRSKLAGMIWPDKSEQKARNSLRQAILNTRKQMHLLSCDCLQANRSLVYLSAKDVTIDATELISHIQSGDELPQRLLETPPVPDGYLSFFSDSNSLFQDWVTERRQNYLMQLQAALRTVQSSCTELPRSNRICRALLSLDPGDEGAARIMMSNCSSSGDVSGALKCYSTLWTFLEDHFDVQPSEVTQQLAVSIKLGEHDKLSQFEVNPIFLSTQEPNVELMEPRVEAASISESGVPVLAVLPFSIIKSEKIPDYLCDLVAEDIVCRLSNLDEMAIVSSNSTRIAVEKNRDYAELRQQFSADYVLDGSVVLSGKIYRFNTQIIDARTSIIVWGKSFEIELKNLHSLQTAMVREIAGAIAPSVHLSELKLSIGLSAASLSAYQLVLRAKERMFELTRAGFTSAKELLMDAIEKDKTFSMAHFALAEWYSLSLGQGWSSDGVGDLAKLESSAWNSSYWNVVSGRPLSLLAHNKTIYRREFGDALALIDQALEKSPHDAETLMWSGPTLAYCGRVDESVKNTEKALRLSPQDPYVFRYEHFCGIAHFLSGNYERSVYYGNLVMRRNPVYTSNLRFTAASLAALGRTDEANLIKLRVEAIEPHFRLLSYAERAPFRERKHVENYINLLEKAGFQK